MDFDDVLQHISLEDIPSFIMASTELLTDDVFRFLAEGYFLRLQQMSAPPTISETDANAIVERLLSLASTAQRTLDWYKQGQEVLTASQFATILKGPRTRGQLVLEKATELTDKDVNTKPLCVPTQYIRPFDWGIRFEPVIKQIYEDLTKSKVADLGRILHTHHDKLAASPDGLVTEGERKGRLVEFKAPISRVIKEEEVPKDYWMQMQIQMEVTDTPYCDYFEVQFSSPAGVKEWVKPDEDVTTVHYKGTLYLIGSKETEQPIRYFYPSLKSQNEPELKDDEILLETIPWYCIGYHLKPVPRDAAWFESMKPHIQSFWADVKSAKEGTYVLPAATRKRKAEECLIRDDV